MGYFDTTAVVSSYSSPEFVLSRAAALTYLDGRNARDGGQGTDALPLRGGGFVSAVSQLRTGVIKRVAS